MDPSGNQPLPGADRWTAKSTELRFSGDCDQGTIAAGLRVNFEGPASFRGSAIQKLKGSYSIRECATGQSQSAPWLPTTAWFEGWNTGNRPSDRREMSVQIKRTRGYVKMEWWTGFLHGYDSTKPPWGRKPDEGYRWSKPNCVVPKLPANAQMWKSIFRGYLELRWDCCCKERQEVCAEADTQPSPTPRQTKCKITLQL